MKSLHLQQISLSTNIVIFAIIGFVVLYGIFVGHAKLRNLALSVFVGIVLANQLGTGLHDWLVKNHHDNLSLSTIKLILFIAPIILLEFSRRHHAKGGHHGMIISVVLSILTAGLIIGMGLGQLQGATLKHITDSSVIAFEIYNFRLWLVALVPALIIAEAFIGPGRDDHKRH